ncbi:hypothetical protein [Enterococcus sp. AZ102]|uniref:hypothetical protein n=1 Tax=Enterococcus sp. AZ102 TaxID=2774865 RepID=UPI003F2672BA
MRLAVVDAYEVLKEAELLKGVKIYTNSIPESATTTPKLPVCRIVELFGNYENYSSDEAHSFESQIQIDLWCNDFEEVDKYYFDIDVLMSVQNWQCTYSSQEDDPDLEDSMRIIKRYTKKQFN